MSEGELELPWRLSYFVEPGYLLPVIMGEDNLKNTMQKFEVRDDDVFLVTYPKAGTNWTCEIIDAIQHVDNLEVLKTRSLIEKTPLMELGPSIHPEIIAEGVADVPSILEAIHAPSPSPRKLPTHLLPKFLPPQLFTKKPKTIFVDRNPKDCIVSLFGWHESTRFLARVEWDHFFDAYLKGLTEYGPYPEFIKAWYPYKDEPWFLWTRYEELKKDPKGSIKKIAEFLGKNLTEEQLNEIVRITGFEYMKKANENVKGREFILRPEGVWQRKGVVGGWKGWFTVAQNEAFEKQYNERMKEYGLEHLKYKF
ncbi:sulfotransferase 1C4-like [Ptychodera flava]|uniref:sulfotransferase 1C4-like n=1 Tax=Ptychodera flava TaxID=63121 RepID=UPI00396A4BB0